jgi:hypothetical protein
MGASYVASCVVLLQLLLRIVQVRLMLHGVRGRVAS